MGILKIWLGAIGFVLLIGSFANAQDAAASLRVDVTKPLRVLIKPIDPFVSNNPDRPTGFSVDLWDMIARDNGWETRYVFVPTLSDLLEGVRNNQGDLAIAAVSITAEREREFDFSYPYFNSGLQVLVRNSESSGDFQVWGAIRDLFWSKGFAIAAIIFLLSVLIVAHIVWVLERKRNDQFSTNYVRGIADAFWWAIVTVTSVGYGDKTPSRASAKAFALFWMIFGYFMFAYFTAVVTSKVTVQELRGSISGPDDLYGKQVAVIDQSTSSKFFVRRGQLGDLVPVENIEEGYALLRAGKVEAVVHDAPVLQHYAQRGGKNDLRLVGALFNKDEYGILLPRQSALREQINLSILRLREGGDYGRLYKKWFGE